MQQSDSRTAVPIAVPPSPLCLPPAPLRYQFCLPASSLSPPPTLLLPPLPPRASPAVPGCRFWSFSSSVPCKSASHLSDRVANGLRALPAQVWGIGADNSIAVNRSAWPAWLSWAKSRRIHTAYIAPHAGSVWLFPVPGQGGAAGTIAAFTAAAAAAVR